MRRSLTGITEPARDVSSGFDSPGVAPAFEDGDGQSIDRSIALLRSLELSISTRSPWTCAIIERRHTSGDLERSYRSSSRLALIIPFAIFSVIKSMPDSRSRSERRAERDDHTSATASVGRAGLRGAERRGDDQISPFLRQAASCLPVAGIPEEPSVDFPSRSDIPFSSSFPLSLLSSVSSSCVRCVTYPRL